MEWTLLNKYALNYILNGETTNSWFFKLIDRSK